MVQSDLYKTKKSERAYPQYRSGVLVNQLHSCVLFLLYMYIITAIVHEGDKGIKGDNNNTVRQNSSF